MIHVTAEDVADALNIPLSVVIEAMVILLPTTKFRERVGAFDESYSLKNLSLHWRAILMLRNHLSKGKSVETKREYDEFAVELVKLYWPGAPVEVRKPCKSCSTRSKT